MSYAAILFERVIKGWTIGFCFLGMFYVAQMLRLINVISVAIPESVEETIPAAKTKVTYTK